MSQLTRLAQELRNAFDAHDRPAHEAALARLRRLEAVVPAQGCNRGDGCLCSKHAQAVCMYRVNVK